MEEVRHAPSGANVTSTPAPVTSLSVKAAAERREGLSLWHAPSTKAGGEGGGTATATAGLGRAGPVGRPERRRPRRLVAPSRSWALPRRRGGRVGRGVAGVSRHGGGGPC